MFWFFEALKKQAVSFLNKCVHQKNQAYIHFLGQPPMHNPFIVLCVQAEPMLIFAQHFTFKVFCMAINCHLYMPETFKVRCMQVLNTSDNTSTLKAKCPVGATNFKHLFLGVAPKNISLFPSDSQRELYNYLQLPIGLSFCETVPSIPHIKKIYKTILMYKAKIMLYIYICLIKESNDLS